MWTQLTLTKVNITKEASYYNTNNNVLINSELILKHQRQAGCHFYASGL